MKLKAKFSGHDGEQQYEAGDTLEGNTEHNQRLLFNNAAEPLDQAAKDFVAKREDMKDSEAENHRLHSEALLNLKEDVKVRKSTAKRGKSKK
jgi:hypothetical protein